MLSTLLLEKLGWCDGQSHFNGDLPISRNELAHRHVEGCIRIGSFLQQQKPQMLVVGSDLFWINRTMNKAPSPRQTEQHGGMFCKIFWQQGTLWFCNQRNHGQSHASHEIQLGEAGSSAASTTKSPEETEPTGETSPAGCRGPPGLSQHRRRSSQRYHTCSNTENSQAALRKYGQK